MKNAITLQSLSGAEYGNMLSQGKRNPAKTKGETKMDKKIREIALRELRIETLETRHSDSLDFHDISVWSLKAALKAAYEAGQNSGTKGAKKQ